MAQSRMLRPIVITIAICLIAFSVSLKIRRLNKLTPDNRSEARLLHEYMTHRGFLLQSADLKRDPPTEVFQKGECQVTFLDVSPSGWHRDVVKVLTNGRYFFLFNGAIYAEQPVWLTWTHSLMVRFFGGIAELNRAQSVIAVTVSPNCGVGFKDEDLLNLKL